MRFNVCRVLVLDTPALIKLESSFSPATPNLGGSTPPYLSGFTCFDMRATLVPTAI